MNNLITELLLLFLYFERQSDGIFHPLVYSPKWLQELGLGQELLLGLL